MMSSIQPAKAIQPLMTRSLAMTPPFQAVNRLARYSRRLAKSLRPRETAADGADTRPGDDPRRPDADRPRGGRSRRRAGARPQRHAGLEPALRAASRGCRRARDPAVLL